MTPRSADTTDKYLGGGMFVFLLILLLVPGLRENLDIRFKISKTAYISVYQLFIILDLMILMYQLFKSKIKAKFPTL